MQPLKTFGLAAVAAAVLIALVGAATASATVLCKNNSSTTACSETYGAGTEVKSSLVSGTKSKLVTAFKTIECSESSVVSKTSNAGSSTETISGSIETLTFGGCNCTVTVLKKGSFEIHQISGTDNGTFTSNGAEVTVSCSTIFGTVHCIYLTGNTDIGTLTGGSPAKLKAATSLPRLATNGLCSENAEWSAEYEITSPKPLYVANAGGGGGATSTTLTTALSGEEKSGEEITINEGAKVKDTATLSGTNASKATGTVKYKVYADKECKELVTSAGEVTVSEGKVPASEEKELEAGRVYYWQAEYSGDSNNLKSTSTCGKEVLTVVAKTSISTSLSGESKSGEEITVNEGAKVKDTATLSGTNASKATGKISFNVFADNECKEPVTSAGEGSLSEGKASSEEKMLEAARIYYWQASYEGDSLHQASTGACGKEVLTVKAAIVVETKLLGENPEGEEPIEGEEITITEGQMAADSATLSGTKASTATGEVSFDIYSDNKCKELVAAAGGESLEEEHVYSEEVTLEEGTYYWQASYEGDSLHQASSTLCGDEVLTVKAAIAVSIVLTAGEETGETIFVEGEEAVTGAASLSGTHASIASGKVEYNVYADSECTELIAEAGEVTVSEGEVLASEAVTTPEAGVYFWQAHYTGGAVNGPSTSFCGAAVEERGGRNVTLYKEVGGAAGPALAVPSEVKGSSPGFTFRTRKLLVPSPKLQGLGPWQIICGQNKFVGTVQTNGNSTAVINLTSWEFKNGGGGEHCGTTMKNQAGDPIDAEITAIQNGTLELPTNRSARIKDFEVRVKLFKEGIPGAQIICQNLGASVPASFDFNAALGLRIPVSDISPDAELAFKLGEAPCNPWIKIRGVFEIKTGAGDKVTPKVSP